MKTIDKKERYVNIFIEGKQVATQVVYCDDNRSRHVGLLGRNTLSTNEGVLMTMPFGRRESFGLMTSIHMVGMQFPIAVAWINQHHQVVDSKLAVPGGMFYGTWRKASYVLEVHPDFLKQLSKGTKVEWRLD